MKPSFTLLFLLLVALLDRQLVFPATAPTPAQVEKWQAVLDMPPPDAKEHSKAALAKIYLERGRAANALGDLDREVQELSAGTQVIGAQNPASYDLHRRLADIHVDKGDLISARAFNETALAVTTSTGNKFFRLNSLSSISSSLRDRDSALSYLAQAEAIFSSERRFNNEWSRLRDLWQASIAEMKGHFNFAFGYLSEAETRYRECATAIRAYLGKNLDASDPNYAFWLRCSSQLVEVAAQLGHVREAGAYVNDVAEGAKAFAQTQRRDLFVTRTARPIARVYLEQGLVKEARDLLAATIKQTHAVERGEASLHAANARYLLALIEMVHGNWLTAEEYFRARIDGLRANAAQANERGSVASEWGYTLMRLGRVGEAIDMLNANLEFREKHDDDSSINLWEARAFHALGVGAGGDRVTAVNALASAIPKILELGRSKGATEAGYLTSARLNWILDGYIGFLAELSQRGARVGGVEPYAEAFRMADLARGSKVQKALSAAIIRASINDPALAGVLRKAQDLEYQVKTASEALTSLQSGESNPEREKLVDKTRADLARLREENEKAQAELKRKIPDYSELLDPKPLTIAETQKLLKPQEALISIYSTQKQTLVWAMSAQGQPAFHVADLPSSIVNESVARLRKALDPSEADIGQVPTFDFNTAHELYQKILSPVEAGWKNANELIIVPHGALSELPFSVLVSQSFQPNSAGIPFADHAATPWLIKNTAISYLPSLSALASLRRGATQPATNAFIGFGDPVFGSVAKTSATPVSRSMVRRNAKDPTAPSKPSSNLELLQPLPDTAEEVREIAKILRADANRDVHLGRRASEQALKNTDLSNYRVVMFATHGLVPGELPDLNQPALALSNPAVTGEKDDGLLTLAEILELKLRADWVVLSACNTASADGQASEAVSGLGRAFFFAGAKALLVSHWPVETVSAKLLTTELFKRQTADAKISRAQALRAASLALMQQSAKPDRGPAFSYAHPMFWAPFVVVGDGG
jgi:CHAT domain-containing protein